MSEFAEIDPEEVKISWSDCSCSIVCSCGLDVYVDDEGTTVCIGCGMQYALRWKIVRKEKDENP